MKKQLQRVSNLYKKLATASSMQLALESRLLFDGAVLATVTEAVDDQVAVDGELHSDSQVDAELDFIGDANSVAFSANDFFQDRILDAFSTEPVTNTFAGTLGAASLLVIDPRAEGANQIIQSPPTDTEIRVLNPNADGYQQISDILKSRSDTADIQIQTATIDGKPFLGTSQALKTFNYEETQAVIDWGDHFAPHTQIIFHGAFQETGKAWLNQVHALTGGHVEWSQENVVSQSPLSIAFIDTRIENYQALVKDIAPKATIILLDPNEDGIDQISQSVQAYHNIDAIHILSHGAIVELTLGNTVLNKATLQTTYARQFSEIGTHLSNNADLLLYGCDVAATEQGKQFISTLATLTGADVAASTDDTGAAALGGNWKLENMTGAIAASSLVAQDFQGLLATTTPPSVDLNGTTVVGNDNSVTFTESVTTAIASTPIAPSASLAGTTIKSLTIIANAVPDGAAESLKINGNSFALNADLSKDITVGSGGGATEFRIAYVASTQTFTITSTTPNGNLPNGGNLNTLVKSIAYENTSNTPTTIDRVFTFTAIDAVASVPPSIATATVKVVAANDPPVVTAPNATLTIDEDTTFSLAGFSIVGDPDAKPTDVMTVTLQTNGTAGTLSANSTTKVTASGSGAASVVLTGTITDINDYLASSATQPLFTPKPNFNGSTSVTIRAIDSGIIGTPNQASATSRPATLSITITSVDDITIDVSEEVSMLQGTTRTVGAFTGLLANSIDPEADPRSILYFEVAGINGQQSVNTPLDIPGVGTLTINANGSYIFEPLATFVGKVPKISYFLPDSLGSTIESTLTIKVNEINSPPTGADNTVTFNEDAIYTFSAEDFKFSDPNNSPADAFVSVIIKTLPPAVDGILKLGSVAITTGQEISVEQIPNMTFTPSVNHNGNGLGNFIFAVHDDGGIQNQVIAPTLPPPGTRGVADAFPSNQSGFFQIINAQTDGTAIINGQLYSFDVLNSNYVPIGSPSGIVYNATGYDPATGFIYGIASSAGSDANGVTVAAKDLIKIDRDGEVSKVGSTTLPFSTNAGDVFNGQLYTMQGTGPLVTVLDLATGKTNLTFNLGGVGPSAELLNFHGVMYSLSNINAVLGSGEGMLYSFDVTDVIDKDTVPVVTHTITGFRPSTTGGSGAGYVAVNQDTGNPEMYFSINATGEIYRIDDPTSANPKAVLVAQGIPTNSNDGASVPGSILPFRQIGFDIDQSPKTFSFNITPINDPPLAADKTISIDEDNVYTLTVADFGFSDPIDASLPNSLQKVILTQLPPATEGVYWLNGVAVMVNQVISVSDINSGLFKFVPAANLNGGNIGALIFKLQDEGGIDTSLTSNTLLFTVNPINDPPVASPASATGNEDSSITFSLTGTDIDGTVTGLTITSLPMSTQGTLYFADGVTAVQTNAVLSPAQASGLVFKPAANYNTAVDGPVIIPFTVTDEIGAISAPATVSITIASVNDAPVATPLNISGEEDTPIPVKLTGTDIDGTVAGAKLTSLPPVDQGVLKKADGTLVALNANLTSAEMAGLIFVPATNFNGSVQAFSFVVIDDQGVESTPASISLTINPVNDVPDATPATATGNEDNVISFSLTGTDIDGTVIGLTITSLPTPNQGIIYLADGITAVQANKELTPAQASGLVFKPAANYNTVDGPVIIPFTVTDDTGAISAPATVSINITSVNDAPLATPLNTSGDEDTPIPVKLTGTDVDDTVAGAKLTSLPPVDQGVLKKADGTSVVLNANLTSAEMAGLIFVPAINFNGSVQAFSFVVIDDQGAESMPATLSITVNPVNDTPVATPTIVTGNEDTLISVNLAGTDVEDVVAPTINVSILPSANQGVLYLADGTTPVISDSPLTSAQAAGLIFKPAPKYNTAVDGPIIIPFTVTDSNGTVSASADASISVSSVNDAPVAISKSIDSLEDTSVPVSLVGTDLDGTITQITITQIPAVTEGVLTKRDGTLVAVGDVLSLLDAADLVFIPKFNYNSTDFNLVEIEFTATDDGNATSVPGTFIIDVGQVNDAPAASPVSESVLEDTPVTITLGGTDPDIGDSVKTVNLDKLPTAEQGILYLADGTTPVVAGIDYPTSNFVFKPSPNFNGAVDIFTFTVKDQVNQLSSSANISLTITAVNDAPVATPIITSGDEDTMIPVTLTGKDVDGTIAGVQLTSLPPIDQGVLMKADGTPVVLNVVLTSAELAGLVFVPAPHFNGVVDPFNYFITDDQGGESTEVAVNITVNAINDPPSATPVTLAGTEDSDIPVKLAGTDIEDGVPNIVTITTLPPASQGVLYLADGITPVVANRSLTAAQAAGLIFKPAANYNTAVDGAIVIAFTVTDSEGVVSPSANASITVQAVNDIPVAIPFSTNGEEDTPIPVVLIGTDVEGPIVSITITAVPPATEGVLTKADGSPVKLGEVLSATDAASLSFVPAANFFGPVTPITFTVQDSNGDSSPSAAANLTVNAVNDPPSATPVTLAGTEDSDIPVKLTGTDIEDGVPNIVTIITLPPASQGVLYLADGKTPVVANRSLTAGQAAGLIFKPADNYNTAVDGAIVIAFTVTDSEGAVSPSANASITVQAVNDIPVAIPFSTNGEEDTPIPVVLIGTDVEGPIVSITITAVPPATEGVLTKADGSPVKLGEVLSATDAASLSFVPAANFFGPVTPITFTVQDSNGDSSSSAAANLTVNAVNDPPIAIPAALTSDEDTPLTLNLLGADVESPIANVTITNLPPDTQGVVTKADGSLVLVGMQLTPVEATCLIFIPVADFNGVVNLTFIVKDIQGSVSPGANVTITVNPVNDRPITVLDENNGFKNNQLTGNVLDNDSDIEGDPLVVSGYQVLGLFASAGTPLNLPDIGTIIVNVDGSYIFTPAADFDGLVPQIEYSVSDGNSTEIGILNLTISSQIALPLAVPDTATGLEGQPVSGNVLSNDFDPEGIAFTVTEFSVDTNGDGIPEVFLAGSAATITGAGKLIINSNGSFTFIPLNHFKGDLPEIIYTAQVGLATVSSTLDISIQPVNKPPTAQPDIVITQVAGVTKGNVLLNDTDPNDDPLLVIEYTIAGVPGVFPAGVTASIPGVGILLIDKEGDFSFIPNPDYQGSIPLITYKISDGKATSTATLAFSSIVTFDNGSNILLSNPSAAFSIEAGNKFGLTPFREPEQNWKSDESTNPFSRLSLNGSLLDYKLYLTASLPDQVVIETEGFSFAIPPSTFRHSNPNENLSIEASNTDGTPSPIWLHFDPKQLKFFGVPPKGAVKQEIMVKAKDSYGSEVSAEFSISTKHKQEKFGHKKIKLMDSSVKVSATTNNKIAHTRPEFTYESLVTSKRSFSEQINSSGKMGRLMQSRALLNSLLEVV